MATAAPIQNADVFTCKNPHGLTVEIRFGDITDQTADAIVVPEGVSFDNLGYVGRRMMEMIPEFGPKREKIIEKSIKKKEPLQVWDVYTSECKSKGKKFGFILHAIVTPPGKGVKKQDWEKQMMGLYKRVFGQVDRKTLSDVVVPLLGSGRGGGNLEVAINAAVLSAAKFKPGMGCLKRIIFVSNDNSIVHVFGQTLTLKGKNRPLPPVPGSAAGHKHDRDKKPSQQSKTTTSSTPPWSSSQRGNRQFSTGSSKSNADKTNTVSRGKMQRTTGTGRRGPHRSDKSKMNMQFGVQGISLPLDGKSHKKQEDMSRGIYREKGLELDRVNKREVPSRVNQDMSNKGDDGCDSESDSEEERHSVTYDHHKENCHRLDIEDVDRRSMENDDKNSSDQDDEDEDADQEHLNFDRQDPPVHDSDEDLDAGKYNINSTTRAGDHGLNSNRNRDQSSSTVYDRGASPNSNLDRDQNLNRESDRGHNPNRESNRGHSPNRYRGQSPDRSSDRNHNLSRESDRGHNPNRVSDRGPSHDQLDVFPADDKDRYNYQDHNTFDEYNHKGARPKTKLKAFRKENLEFQKTQHQETQNAATENGDAIENEKEMCPICLDEIHDRKVLPKCRHVFCRECIDDSFSSYKPVCPSCNMVYGILTGDQPKGDIDVGFSNSRLPGYESYDTITITYHFPNGRQGANHPNPGQFYKGTTRVAYLPANKEGKKVLKLLKAAFKRNLTFTIGRSTTTGRENVVTWNDIHHKTNMEGGPTNFGYPDPGYLSRVKEELASKGVTEENI